MTTQRDLTFHWFLPTNGGDGRHVVGGGHGLDPGAAGRPASVPFLGQVARAAEDVGFEAALTPTGAWCEDAWLSTAMLSQVSARLKFLVAFRPGLTSRSSPRRWPGRSRTSPGAACCSTWSPVERATSSGCTATSRTRTHVTHAATSSSPSSARSGVARPSTSPATTFATKGHGSGRSPTPCRRSTSGDRRRRPDRSRLATPTSTSRGASDPTPYARRWSGSARWPPTRDARSASGSGST